MTLCLFDEFLSVGFDCLFVVYVHLSVCLLHLCKNIIFMSAIIPISIDIIITPLLCYFVNVLVLPKFYAHFISPTDVAILPFLAILIMFHLCKVNLNFWSLILSDMRFNDEKRIDKEITNTANTIAVCDPRTFEKSLKTRATSSVLGML